MSVKLKPGDKIQFTQNNRNLRGEVADTLNLKTRGEELFIPVIRPFNRKNIQCNADRLDGSRDAKLKVRWIPRKLVRKLPEFKEEPVQVPKKRKPRKKAEK